MTRAYAGAHLGAVAAVLAAALVAGACSDRKAAPPAALPTGAPAQPTPPRPAEAVIGAATTQLVTAVIDDWTSTHATLALWRRGATAWERVGEPWPGVVGRTGSAWGIGLHGVGAPGRAGPVKQEGDGKSPAGAFAIRDAYGYAVEPPEGVRLTYTSSGRGDLECVDDPASDHYAQIIDRKQVPSDWESAEQLLRDDPLYTWVIDVAHNPERTPRKGSCIFLHVWGGPESATIGCTAMAERQLVELMRALDPAAMPVFVLLPRAEYQALAMAWGLPPQ